MTIDCPTAAAAVGRTVLRRHLPLPPSVIPPFSLGCCPFGWVAWSDRFQRTDYGTSLLTNLLTNVS